MEVDVRHESILARGGRRARVRGHARRSTPTTTPAAQIFAVASRAAARGHPLGARRGAAAPASSRARRSPWPCAASTPSAGVGPMLAPRAAAPSSCEALEWGFESIAIPGVGARGRRDALGWRPACWRASRARSGRSCAGCSCSPATDASRPPARGRLTSPGPRGPAEVPSATPATMTCSSPSSRRAGPRRGPAAALRGALPGGAPALLRRPLRGGAGELPRGPGVRPGGVGPRRHAEPALRGPVLPVRGPARRGARRSSGRRRRSFSQQERSPARRRAAGRRTRAPPTPSTTSGGRST